MSQEQNSNQNSNNKNANQDFSNFKVNKKGFIEVSGEILETLPSITFRVKLENDHEILARLSGKMRMHRIMLLPGDKVKIEMSPYDLDKGRITYRY
ncbi:translation initiation factor IF-1 [Candidatus Parcubacteria bacterium]|nr:translation initiation factor IF-1 [Patescibacteria group bacterium]MCG2686901.1 translation initiation factor IF-1 [Candidatus Parcubacteria bacterium]